MNLHHAKARLKYYLKKPLWRFIYRHYPIGLQPERLYAWMDALWKTRDQPGEIVEVGCLRGGTSAFAANMLLHTGFTKPYLCVDTFDGFVDEQFNEDVRLGNERSNQYNFHDNSMDLVRWVLTSKNTEQVRLLKADISAIEDDALPEVISACLLDVDLAVPIYDGLKKLHPRLAPGGVILVDDCPENYDWQARAGYAKYMKEMGLEEHYFMDMGVVAGPEFPGFLGAKD